MSSGLAAGQSHACSLAMSRRRFLGGLCGSAAAAALSPLIFAASARGAARRPNIILVMADDMGFSDLGCYGSEIQTPTLNRLAAGGVRFTQFYNTARCCPSRAALLTGLYQHQAGIGAMVGDRGFPSYQGYLNDRCVTIAEALRQGNYHALMTGKWHVGEQRPHWPLDRGFEKYFGLISGASNYWGVALNDPKGAKRAMAADNEPIAPKADNFYMTDAFSDAAVNFIDAYGRKENPFFLYVAYTAPHWPLHAWPEDIAKYKNPYKIGWDELRTRRHKRLIEMGIVDPRWPLTPRDPEVPAWQDAKDKEWETVRMAVYAAQIDRFDQGIGRIMAKVKEIGAEENTLVMFLSDNGGCHEVLAGNDPKVNPGPRETYMSYGRGWANASNTPFRLYKHWVHEGGIATSFIAYWPAVIKAGQITHQVGHIIDLMPTCLDAAGVEYPKTYNGREILPVEGRSLLPIFQGKERAGHEALFWEHEGNRAVRQGRWKLVSRYPQSWELYDLEADRTELNDLSAKHPDKLKELIALYDKWAERCGVLTPEQLKKGKK